MLQMNSLHVQVCVGVIDGYLFVYLDQLGAPPSLLGACLMMIGAAELPVFAYSGQILNVLGYSGSLHLALAAFCCRLLVYSTVHLMPTYWIVAPCEMLHGITFGIAWAAGVNYCRAAAPEGLKSTIQSFFSATYYGLGRAVGGLVGGLMLHRFGGPVLFGSVATFTFSSWIAISIAELIVSCNNF
jgi:MFS transporter, PPP family, 3-phenylpropionic acid transporter